ncbi:MAG TPA: DUF1178 family protein [Burkholderiaceae bacterium]|nr:DUF1178 family protein [Burkholderiaceae bacterium]
MKVFNLGCRQDHRFEGWFASADDYEVQLGGGLLECPMCGDREIQKLPSAPRLNLSGAGSQQAAAGPRADAVAGRNAAAVPADPRSAATNVTPEQLQAMWFKLARQLVQNTEDVGAGFAEEARRIHYREAPERGIRGVASVDEREALAEEGIEVFSFPLPRGIEDPIQ